MAGYRVTEGTQVHLNGITYDGGDKLPAGVPSETLARWMAQGWVTEVTLAASPRVRRSPKRS